MLDTLERLILLQIGAAAATRERVQEVVNRLIEQGRMEREEGRAVVEDVLTRARERSSGTRGLIDASVQQGLRGVGIPNRESYEDLLFRIEQLEHRVRLLEDRPEAGSPEAGGPEAPVSAVPPVNEPASTETPTTGIDVAPQPPRDEPDTPPGLQPHA
jgi:polyhydroxyalkanoate synthesis regulator phasin